MDEDTTLTVTAANGALANDTDADSQTLTATIATQPAKGTVTFNSNGSFTYIPNANFSGTDSFTYRANDGTVNSNTATVNITVNPVADPPVATDDSYTVAEDTPLSRTAANGVLANDSDPDGGNLTATKLTDPAHGTLAFNSDGSFTYTPNANFNGPDSFTYQVANQTSTAIATVDLTVTSVNDVPQANADFYSVDEDGSLTVNIVNGLLANDTDSDGDSLSAVKITDPANGILVFNADGSFTYTPNADFNGSDSFTYRASDGTANSNTVTVTIDVNSIPDSPVANDDSYTVAEDTPLSRTAVNGVLANDSDPDGDGLIATKLTDPAHGTLAFNSDGSFTYTPNANFTGFDSFTYQVANQTSTAIATVDITVTSVNDNPQANDDFYSVDEDGSLTVNVANGVLANDTDGDGDTLTATKVTNPAHGTLVFNADGSFTYVPDADFHGVDSFTYRASDITDLEDIATVTITVNSLNDAPMAVADTYEVAVDGTLTVPVNGVLDNDIDVDGDSLTAILVDDVSNGTLAFNADGSFSYTPNSSFHGTDSFTYMANDGSLNSVATTVTIHVNDAPVVQDDDYSVDEDAALTIDAPNGVLMNDSDPNSDPLVVTLVTGPEHGELQLNEDGSFTYTPDGDFHGTDTFVYKVNDGTTDSINTTVTITVNPINDPPVALADSYQVTAEQTLTVNIASGILLNDTDVDGDSLTATLITDVAHGVLSLNADGSFQYTPTSGFVGTDSFTYKATDGVLESLEVEVEIEVLAEVEEGLLAGLLDEVLDEESDLLAV